MTDYLGITAAQLRTQLEAGKSLADVAKAQGKTVAGLEDAIVAAATKKLDAAVAAGKLTAAQKATMLADLKSNVDDIVNRTGPPPRGPARSRQAARSARPAELERHDDHEQPADHPLGTTHAGRSGRRVGGRALVPAPAHVKCGTPPICQRPPLRLPSPQRRSRVLESLPALTPTVAGPKPRRARRRPVSGFRRATKLVAFSLASTKERREMRTRATDTHDVNALRGALAARLPGRPAGAPRKPDELEERCRLYLQHLRWPAGVECPRCDERDRLLWLDSRDKWHCYSCRYQFSVTAGTLFHSSHLPLWKWFVSVQLMTETPRGISANRLRHILGGSYKTFWFTTHRIRVGDPRARPAAPARRRRRARRGRRLVAGPHHHLSDKYLDAYVEERRWLEANQGNPHVFRDTILALVTGEGLSYDQLVAAR